MSNSNNNNNWIDAIKHKTDQATREVPEGTWEAIAKSLPQQAAPSTKRAIITPRLWKGIAAAAAVAIAATTGFFLLDVDEQNTEQAQIASITKPQPAQQPAQHPDSATVAPASTLPASLPPLLAQAPATSQPSHKASTAPSHGNRHISSAAATPARRSQHMASAQHDYLEQDTIEFYPEDEYYASEEFNPDEYFYDLETMQALEELYAEYDNAMNQEAMQPWNNYNDSTYQQHLVYDANARRAAREKMALTKRHKKPTMLMAAYGNGLISTDRNATVNGSSSAMLLPAAGGSSTMMMAPGITPKVAPPVNYSYHHHMPLTAGLTFSKRITRNIYGNVGVNFTSMSSDVTPDNGAPEFKQNIKLVGVPFGMRWKFWQYRGLSTFVGAEGMMEKVVSAKFNNESVSIKRLQWSVHATAGLQYNFNRYIGIYVEPKLSHYITTMPLNTLRNEHPLNFNLQMGLSLDF